MSSARLRFRGQTLKLSSLLLACEWLDWYFVRLPKLNLDESYFPQSSQIIRHNGYTVEYSFKNLAPLWVYEVLTPDQPKPTKALKRPQKFHSEKSLPEAFQVTHDDYTRSGYSRGHMSMAFYLKHFKESYHQTFSMANIVPQLRANNEKIWLSIEQTIRRLALQSFDKTHVWSGPVYSKEIDQKYISKRNIPVPTHLYKVVMFEKDREQFSFALIIANTDENKLYLIKIEDLENMTGVLFPAIVKQAQQSPPLCALGSNPEKWAIAGK